MSLWRQDTRIASIMLLSLVLAFGIVWGSVLPALAQGKVGIAPNNSSLVYQPGEQISFTVTVDGLAADDLSGSELSWKVTNVKGKVVCAAKSNAKAEPVQVRIPLRVLGHFKLAATVARDGRALADGNTTFAVVPLPPEIPNEANPYGVNFHLVQIPVEEAREECAVAKRIGIGWGRDMLPDWAWVCKKGRAPDWHWKAWDPETNADKGYEWETWDPLADVVRKSGISPLALFFSIPRWGSGAPQEVTSSDIFVYMMPDDTTEFTKFCEQAAARYKDFVQYWEVGNEVDSSIYWKGTWKDYNEGNDEGIIKDYVRFLAAARKGFLKGNPKAKILFAGTTAAMPLGDTYQPFLATAMANGAGKEFDVMNTHYMADLPGIKKVMREAGAGDKPIWITEIGRWSTPRGELSGQRWQIIQDITTIVIQQAAGAQRFFKFNLRDDGIDKYSETPNFGLVYRDFSPKPSYVAYATLIRYFASARFKKELNVVTQSDHGWLRGYAYTSPSDTRPRNILWLNDAKSARVTLLSVDKSVTVVDIMGNAVNVPVVRGKVALRVDDLPFIVLGRIAGRQGSPVYPAPKVIRTLEVSLRNPGFEEAGEAGTIPGWSIGADIATSGVNAFIDNAVSHSGKQSVCIEADKPAESFWMVSQVIPLDKVVPQVGPNEYVTFSVEGWLKYQDVKGTGASFNCAFHDANGERMTNMGTPYRTGTSDWKLKSFSDVRIRADTKTIHFQPVLGPGMGKLWFDDARMIIKVWRLQAPKKADFPREQRSARAGRFPDSLVRTAKR